jgi:hypothetical protein
MEQNKSIIENHNWPEEQSKEKYGLLSYNAVFEMAYLADHQRALLSLYTLKYNWLNDGEVYTSLPSLARLLGRKDPETVGAWLQELVELGWVEDELRYREGFDHKIHHVRPIIGRDNEAVANKAREMLLKEKGLSDEEREFISLHSRRQKDHEKYITAINNYKPRLSVRNQNKNLRKA